MATRSATEPAWAGMFWAAFKRSRNGMLLLDEQRRCVEVNGAFLRLLGRKRDALIGGRSWEFVKGPRLSERKWKAMLERGDFAGEGELENVDGSAIAIHYAAHPEVVTGRRLILFVVLDSARRGRFRRVRAADKHHRGPLTAREREVVDLVAAGHTAREIADELHIAHNTVRTHVRNAQEKLGARSRAQLVAITLASGHTAH